MMKLLTNFNKNAIRDIYDIIKISGIDACIKKEAYDVFGNELSDYYSAWYDYDGSDEQKKSVEKFFYCCYTLKLKLKDMYMKMGIPEELLQDKKLYRGCEKDLFPEYEIDM